LPRNGLAFVPSRPVTAFVLPPASGFPPDRAPRPCRPCPFDKFALSCDCPRIDAPRLPEPRFVFPAVLVFPPEPLPPLCATLPRPRRTLFEPCPLLVVWFAELFGMLRKLLSSWLLAPRPRPEREPDCENALSALRGTLDDCELCTVVFPPELPCVTNCRPRPEEPEDDEFVWLDELDPALLLMVCPRLGDWFDRNVACPESLPRCENVLRCEPRFESVLPLFCPLEETRNCGCPPTFPALDCCC
jgi:hypothetical protein